MYRIYLSQRRAFLAAITPILESIGASYGYEHFHGVTPEGVEKLADQFMQDVPLTPLGEEHKTSRSYPESDVIQWVDASGRVPTLQNLPPKERTGRRVCPEPMTGAGTRDAELRAFASALAPTRRTLPSSLRNAFHIAIKPVLAAIGASYSNDHYYGVTPEGVRKMAHRFMQPGKMAPLGEEDRGCEPFPESNVIQWEDVRNPALLNLTKAFSEGLRFSDSYAPVGAPIAHSTNPPFIPISTLSDVMLAHPAARARRVRLSESGGVVIAQHVADWLRELSWSEGHAIGTVAGDVDALNQQLKELADKAGWPDIP